MRIDTKLGTIYGKSYAGFDVFKGIPYAQSPKGALRLNMPSPLHITRMTSMRQNLVIHRYNPLIRLKLFSLLFKNHLNKVKIVSH